MSTPSVVTDTHLRQGNRASLKVMPRVAAEVLSGLPGFASTCAGWADNGAVAQATGAALGLTAAGIAGLNQISVDDPTGILNPGGGVGAAIDANMAAIANPVSAPGSVMGTAITAGSLAHLIKVPVRLLPSI